MPSSLGEGKTACQTDRVSAEEKDLSQAVELSNWAGWLPRNPLPWLAFLYLASAFVRLPDTAQTLDGTPHLWLGPIAVTVPYPLSGDSPHYLAAVNSLIVDGDFDLSNNYTAAAKGGWDLGARFRGVAIDRHVDQAPGGAEIGTHSPFMALLLSLFALPFRGTAWVGPVCILATTLAGVLALFLFQHFLTRHAAGFDPAAATVWLALATPLWCYSRDIWSEPWITLIWVALLLSRHPWSKAGLALAGTLLKYPFVVVPLTMGVLALRRKERAIGWTLIASSAGGLVVAVGVVQYLFRDVGHSSLFHSGIHAGFGLPFSGTVGLLFSPENGLLWFFPFLAWGLWEFRKGGDRCLPLVAFFLVHACYQDWAGGTGFSARYLVPMLPVMVWAVCEAKPRGRLFRLAVAWSLFWGFLGGFLPALVYDRSPWGVFGHIVSSLGGHP